MVDPSRQRHSYEEYLALEAMSPVRHEFLDGHVVAMAGGSPDHAAITVNVSSLLRTGLRDRPCRVFSSDLRIRVLATGLGTYPDVSVICGELQTDPDDAKGHTVTNPKVLVEVLSPSTEDYDRGEKLSHYKQIPSLQEIVMLAHDERRLELWRRHEAHWTLLVANGGQTMHLQSIDVALPLAEVYLDAKPDT